MNTNSVAIRALQALPILAVAVLTILMVREGGWLAIFSVAFLFCMMESALAPDVRAARDRRRSRRPALQAG